MFNAIVIDKDTAGYRADVTQLEEARLPEGDVGVRVAYSTLNYKDGLAMTGKSPVVRQFPMVPGIDLAGTVESSSHPRFRVGDQVLLNGWGVGESHWGGLAQKARVQQPSLRARPWPSAPPVIPRCCAWLPWSVTACVRGRAKCWSLVPAAGSAVLP